MPHYFIWYHYPPYLRGWAARSCGVQLESVWTSSRRRRRRRRSRRKENRQHLKVRHIYIFRLLFLWFTSELFFNCVMFLLGFKVFSPSAFLLFFIRIYLKTPSFACGVRRSTKRRIVLAPCCIWRASFFAVARKEARFVHNIEYTNWKPRIHVEMFFFCRKSNCAAAQFDLDSFFC